MPKEYRTIREVAGPLMLVRGVENVAYDELGEIELASGEKRRCKVLEINGNDALVQLFESATGINLSNSKVRFLGRSMELGVSEDMLGRVFDGLGRPIDGGPEILPDEAAAAGAKIVGTGRSDFPNQINNVVAFPGIFRGALDVRAAAITENMKIAAAYAIASLVSDAELKPEYILPHAFDPRIKDTVAAAVAEAARKDGVARI